MSGTCTVVVNNNSGRTLDSVVIWYLGGLEPAPEILEKVPRVISAKGLGAGQSVTGTAQLQTTFADYWMGGVLFQGDGEPYTLCDLLGAPGKEYEVSDGSTITFTIDPYVGGQANPSSVTISYSGDGGGSAHLLNNTTINIIEYGKVIGDILSEAAE